MSSILRVFNHVHYDGNDVSWNALRIAGQVQR
jgi:hypothetical protein